MEPGNTNTLRDIAAKAAWDKAMKPGPRKKKSKFRNVRVDGFDSKGERDRYRELELLLAAGVISGLERQKEFKLEVNGVLICKYRADYIYVEGGDSIVEDFKGRLTREYIIKKRLMKACHGIDIRESKAKRR